MNMADTNSLFGQPASTLVASQSGFGQTNNPSSNLFAPTSVGGSISGATSTGVFGAVQPCSPFSSTATFGASSYPTFGISSMPAFGSSSTPASGISTSAFGGSSGCGQLPGFSFGSTLTQASPFGSTTQQNNQSPHLVVVCLVPPNPLVQLSLHLNPAPPPLVPQAPAFTVDSAFGSTGTPLFGTTGTGFGVSNAPAFGSGATLGASSTPFVASSSAFQGQRGGSRLAFFTPTTLEESWSVIQVAAKLESISAMPVYNDKSHEELRWEDYQLGDKGQTQPTAPLIVGIGFDAPAAPARPFGSGFTFGPRSANAFFSTSANPFQSASSNLFVPPSSTTPSILRSSTPTFSFQPSVFGTASAPATTSSFGTSSPVTPFQFSPAVLDTCAALATVPSFGTSSSLFNSLATPVSFPPSVLGTGPAPVTTPSFGTSSPPSNSSGTPSFSFSTPILGTGAALTTTPSLGTSSSLPNSSVTPFSFPSSTFGTGAAPATTPSFGTGLNVSSSQASSLFESTPAIRPATSSTFGQDISKGL